MSQAEFDAQRERSLELAQRDVADIAALLDFEPFQRYFLRRLNERRDKLKDDVSTDDTLTDLDTRTKRALVREYGELLAMPQRERAMHADTLRLIAQH